MYFELKKLNRKFYNNNSLQASDKIVYFLESGFKDINHGLIDKK
ncbi:4097_t:CDS:2 [Gigaspora margarita]|uniref:4097_t:CDS:1 n=1 Tax=Gigaspora margarita TaxID=4874 RepID=A0ABN7UEP7_GIGMA|nr:4097_t:CDS:2 [Gigaspora margarita]